MRGKILVALPRLFRFMAEMSVEKERDQDRISVRADALALRFAARPT